MKRKPILSTAIGITFTGSILFVIEQVRRIEKRIKAAVSTDVLSLDRLRPQYIYIDDPYIQELLKEGKKMQDETVKLSRLQRWLFDKIQESSVFKNWFLFKKNIAWRYLKIAECEVKSFRLRAAQELAQLDLSDSDYQQIAQSCGLRTAINLARTENINPKFFLDAPYFKQKPSYEAIVKHLQDFIISMSSDGKHPCLQYFLSKNFGDMLDVDPKGFDDDVVFKKTKNYSILMCMDVILHQSTITSNAKEIVKLGGLPLIMEVYKYVICNDYHQTEILIMLSNLLSNISVVQECSYDLFISGWIKILTVLSKYEDMRISVPAAKSLINMDNDDQDGVNYTRRIFPLYPLARSQTKPQIDLIFIHGLLGGAFVTWRQRDIASCGHTSPLKLLGIIEEEDANDEINKVRSVDQDDFQNINLSEISRWNDLGADYEFVMVDIPVDGDVESNSVLSIPGNERHTLTALCDTTYHSKCWPKDWLSADCPDSRILAVNYETNISDWSGMCPLEPGRRNLSERSTQLLDSLIHADVGSRPVVWLAHSMGGLIVKNMLVQASSSQDVRKRKLLENTRGIIFFSTPHKGSHLAALNPTTQMILYPSIEVKELRENSPALLELHENFLRLVKVLPLKILTFAEREFTYITSMKFEMKMVKQESADPDVGEVYGIPLDHLCICKPACRQSFIYQRILSLIQRILQELKEL